MLCAAIAASTIGCKEKERATFEHVSELYKECQTETVASPACTEYLTAECARLNRKACRILESTRDGMGMGRTGKALITSMAHARRGMLVDAFVTHEDIPAPQKPPECYHPRAIAILDICKPYRNTN